MVVTVAVIGDGVVIIINPSKLSSSMFNDIAVIDTIIIIIVVVVVVVTSVVLINTHYTNSGGFIAIAVVSIGSSDASCSCLVVTEFILFVFATHTLISS